VSELGTCKYGRRVSTNSWITADDDLATIRKKYKELLAKYHPDKVQHLGIEFQEMAERKTKAIMEAYEFFQRKHNL